MNGSSAPWERWAPLEAIPGLRHGFLLRVQGLAVDTPEKGEALQRLRQPHEAALREMGLAGWPLVTAEQIHGDGVAVLPAHAEAFRDQLPLAGVDALVTDRRRVILGIYVADCAAVYLVDPVLCVIGLVHSGRKGTELGITGRAIALMMSEFGCRPEDLRAVISPCIRPPAYEVDFAAGIRRQCTGAGIPPGSVFDTGICTSRDLQRFYSYRMEKGRTGRMLAVLGWEE